MHYRSVCLSVKVDGYRRHVRSQWSRDLKGDFDRDRSTERARNRRRESYQTSWQCCALCNEYFERRSFRNFRWKLELFGLCFLRYTTDGHEVVEGNKEPLGKKKERRKGMEERTWRRRRPSEDPPPVPLRTKGTSSLTPPRAPPPPSPTHSHAPHAHCSPPSLLTYKYNACESHYLFNSVSATAIAITAQSSVSKPYN